MPKNINIPVITDLVTAGDPKLKAQAKINHSVPSHIEELKTRIDEIENAIGQDNTGPIGRAYAIRAEESCDKDNEASVNHHHPRKESL